MAAPVRYGQDAQLDRATRRAVVRVAGAMTVTAVLLTLVAAWAVGKILLGFALHGGGGVERALLGWLPWWTPIAVLALVFAASVLYLVRGRVEPRVPGRLEPLPDDDPAAQSLARLSALADLPAPVLLRSRVRGRNAFVVPAGPDGRPRIAVTDEALEALAPDELDAVLAHELAHLAQDDAALVSRLEHVARAARRRGPRAVTEWIVGSVDALLRQRELSADRAASLITGRPSSLVSAVRTCTGEESRPADDLRRALVVGFVAPWEDLRRGRRTHPSLAEREDVAARAALDLGAL